jgi:formylglycine-generating enzyme required for sulfatase activity
LGWLPALADRSAAIDLLDALANDTGLLRFATRDRSGPRVVRPWHRSFQEYLAACALASGELSVAEETDALVAPKAGPAIATDPAWEGVLGFLVGVHAGTGQERARAFLRRLLDHALCEGGAGASPRAGRLLGLVARGAGEYAEHLGDADLGLRAAEAIARAVEAEGCDWPLADRLLALEALGHAAMVDPRLGDPRTDDAIWVEVEGDAFAMGADQKAFQAAPPHQVTVPTFLLAWRPVTVRDYAPFVADGGGEPEDWGRQRYHGNRPVVGVSWDEAVAFCRFATDRWRHPPGWEVVLPSEAEWEYAAAGPEGRVYPWGGEPEPGLAHANFGYGRIGRPSPVGAFPAGACRAHGRAIVDLAGNVWEWCADDWRGPGDPSWAAADHRPFASPGRALRVVRGGSWVVVARFLRCACRDRVVPEVRLVGLGFRVACRPSPEHA